MKRWYVMLLGKPPGGPTAKLVYSSRRNMHLRYKMGRIIEYRGCVGFQEAVVLALIYNYKWAAWIYHKKWRGGI